MRRGPINARRDFHETGVRLPRVQVPLEHLAPSAANGVQASFEIVATRVANIGCIALDDLRVNGTIKGSASATARHQPSEPHTFGFLSVLRGVRFATVREPHSCQVNLSVSVPSATVLWSDGAQHATSNGLERMKAIRLERKIVRSTRASRGVSCATTCWRCGRLVSVTTARRLAACSRRTCCTTSSHEGTTRTWHSIHRTCWQSTTPATRVSRDDCAEKLFFEPSNFQNTPPSQSQTFVYPVTAVKQ